MRTRRMWGTRTAMSMSMSTSIHMRRGGVYIMGVKTGNEVAKGNRGWGVGGAGNRRGGRGQGIGGGDVGRDKPLPLLYSSEGCAGSKHPLGQYSRGSGL